MDTHVERAWAFWNKFGKNPICLAPMAEVNEQAFRMLCRQNGIKVCWTGMLNAHQWSQGTGYQSKYFSTCENDRPLIGQIAGSDYDKIVNMAVDLSRVCDAVDLNLGCTQSIASRSEYGYYMVNTAQKREKILELFRRLSSTVSVPICAKVRIIIDDDGNPSKQYTVDFCKKLEEAGVSIIQIHGRYEHRNKKADVKTDIIKSVVEAVKIPVVANGGVMNHEDALRLIEDTGAAGVSVGQALLNNPSLFAEGGPKPRIEFAREYLELAEKYKEPRFYVPQKHIFKFYESDLASNPELGEQIKTCKTIEDLKKFVEEHP